MDPKVDNSPQPQQELKDSNTGSSAAHSDSDPKKEALLISGGSLTVTDQGPIMYINSPKKSVTEDPNTSAGQTGQSADTENENSQTTTHELMVVDSSHQNSTIENSVMVTPDVKTVVEVTKLPDQAVTYHISINFNEGEPQVGSIEKSDQTKPSDQVKPSNLTVGETIADLLSTSSNKFHSTIGNSAAVTKEFLAPSLLLGNFDEFIKQPPLPRGEAEREDEIKKRIADVSGLSLKDIEKLKKVMRVDRIRKKSELDYYSATHRNLDESGVKLPSSECRRDWHRVMLTRYNKRRANFPQKMYCRTLKYSGDKASIDRAVKYKNVIGNDDLQPNEHLVYVVRLYKPFNHLHPTKKGWAVSSTSRFYRTGRGVSFLQDFHFLGTQTLYQLRDCIRCPNDLGPQQDLSQTPDEDYLIDLKGVFPSAFLFINNVFYNDFRHKDSIDISKPIREWAKSEGLADYEHRSMEGVTFDSINIRLGHPELYMHQGECEHLFTISKVKVLQPTDICISAVYPCSTALNPYYSVNCIICTRLIAKWIVTGCERIPFDPAFVCSVCFKLYLYADGRKLGSFQAYKYQMKNMQITDSF